MNPHDHQKAYGTFIVGKTKLPGIVVDIKGADREWEWQVQKAQGTSGATAKRKGRKVQEAIVVTCELVEATDWDDLEKARAELESKDDKDPEALDVQNAVLNNNRIKSLQVKKIGQEVWDRSGGRWTVEFTFIEYDPSKKSATGAAKGSKSTQKWVEAGAQSEADSEIDKLVKKAKEA